MKRKKGIPLSFFIVFAAAFILAFTVRHLLVHTVYAGAAFFAVLLGVSFAGVWLVSVVTKKRRR